MNLSTVLPLILTSFLALCVSQVNATEVVKDEPFSEGDQFIFFAVLEGLYRDGVSDPSVAAIMGESMTTNFVLSCPICSPAYDALQLYRDRPNFSGRKFIVKDFGNGLKIEERKALVGTPEESRKQVRSLVSRWIEARITRSHLPPEAEQALRVELKEMSDQGTETLKGLKNPVNGKFSAKIYADWEFCPSCSGATLHDPAAKPSETPKE